MTCRRRLPIASRAEWGAALLLDPCPAPLRRLDKSRPGECPLQRPYPQGWRLKVYPHRDGRQHQRQLHRAGEPRHRSQPPTPDLREPALRGCLQRRPYRHRLALLLGLAARTVSGVHTPVSPPAAGVARPPATPFDQLNARMSRTAAPTAAPASARTGGRASPWLGVNRKNAYADRKKEKGMSCTR